MATGVTSSHSGARHGHRALTLVGVGIVFVAWDLPGTFSGEQSLSEALTILVLAAYVLVLGAVIVWKAAGNRVGWMFGAIGVSVLASGAIAMLSDSGVTSLTGLASALWLSWIGYLALVFLWFPTGRSLGPKWNLASWWVYLTLFALVFFSLFSEQNCVESAETGGCARWADNPIGITGVPDAEYGWLSGPLYGSLAVLLVVALASSGIRYARAGATERLQLKPFLLATISFVLGFVAESLSDGLTGAVPTWIDLWVTLSLISIPLSATLSILRYRLYDIDRLVSRTISYGIVIALLAAVVAVVSTVVGTLFESPVVVAATTLSVAAVFNPLRRRVQRWVDRRFNRSRYDAGTVVTEFGQALRDRIETEDIVEAWGSVVTATMQPSSSAVWVRR